MAIMVVLVVQVMLLTFGLTCPFGPALGVTVHTLAVVCCWVSPLSWFNPKNTLRKNLDARESTHISILLRVGGGGGSLMSLTLDRLVNLSEPPRTAGKEGSLPPHPSSIEWKRAGPLHFPNHSK